MNDAILKEISDITRSQAVALKHLSDNLALIAQRIVRLQDQVDALRETHDDR